MNWEAVGIVSTLIASIATLMTLFYLAIQVRESNNLARSSSLLAVLDGFTNNDVNQGFQYPELLDISTRGYQSWESLPKREKSSFDGLMTQKLLHMQKILLYHNNGLIDDGNYIAWLAHTAAMMKTPGDGVRGQRGPRFHDRVCGRTPSSRRPACLPAFLAV